MIAIALAGAALLLAFVSLSGSKRRAAYYRDRLADWRQTRYLPRVTLIVPVKGHDEGLRENLATLASLDYPCYELLVVARGESDIPPGVVPPQARVVLAGEGDPANGEKVNNLIAAVREAQPETEVFAFADSDGRVTPGWLRALVAPLADASTGAATGYRWYVPDRPDFWPLARSVWNAGIFGGFGPGQSPFVWGGAMALRKSVFFAARVPDFWKGSVSDDYGITAAIGAAGLRITYAPGAVVASTDHITARECLRWMRRQLVITRVHYPKLWWMSFMVTAIYCGAMAACVASWNLAGAAILALLCLLWIRKGAGRAALARAVLPAYSGWFRRYGWIHGLGAPPVTWLWLYTHLASAWSNTIEWRGHRYRLRGRDGGGTACAVNAAEGK